MSNVPETRWAGMEESDDRFLQALFAAEELEKLGFELNALRPEQIDELSDTFDLPHEQRQRLRAAIAAKMGLPRWPRNRLELSNDRRTLPTSKRPVVHGHIRQCSCSRSQPGCARRSVKTIA